MFIGRAGETPSSHTERGVATVLTTSRTPQIGSPFRTRTAAGTGRPAA